MSTALATKHDNVIQWVDDKEAPIKIEPGYLYDGLPDNLYHKGPGISKSGLDLINRSPGHFQFNKKNPPPETEAMHIGKAAHALVLEPDEFEKKYIKSEYAAFQSKAAKEWKAQQEAEGKIIIRSKTGNDPVWDASDWEKIHLMRDSIMSHPIASLFLNSGTAERSGYWVDRGCKRLCKLRMDWYNSDHNIIFDLKFVEDASYTPFSMHANKYRYHVQDAFYRHGMRELNGPVGEFIFCCVEKKPPYAVALYVLNRAGKDLGYQIFQRDLDRYHKAMTDDEWPLYPENPKNLELPFFSNKVPIYSDYSED